MFRFDLEEVVYLPMFNHDGTKTFMNYEVTGRYLENGQKKYIVNDLLKSSYNEEKLKTKEEIKIFLETGI